MCVCQDELRTFSADEKREKGLQMEEAEDGGCLWAWRPAVREGHVIVTEGCQYALLWGSSRGGVSGGLRGRREKRFAVSSRKVCHQHLDRTGLWGLQCER